MLDRNRKFVLEELIRVAKETIGNTEKLLADNEWDSEGEFYDELWETVCAINNYRDKGMSGWSTRTEADTKPYRRGQFFSLGPEDDYNPGSAQMIAHKLIQLKKTRTLTEDEQQSLTEACEKIVVIHNQELYADNPEMLAWVSGKKSP
jgi:hypothetical protein